MEPSRALATRIPLRRLVAGAFLHFGVLAYLVVVPVLCLLLAPDHIGAAGLLAMGVRISALFLAALIATALVAVVIAAGIDARAERRSRRLESTDAAASRRRVARAVERARHASAVHDGTARIAGRRWDHDDARYQALSRDLARVVETATAALAGAEPERIAALGGEFAESLDHIDCALAELARERGALAEQDARAAALYVRRRYGAPDFAIKPD